MYEAPLSNLNKGYKSESVKTERSNLTNDNPVAKDASGGRPMILKHMSGSRMGGSPALKHHGAPTMMKDEDFKGKKPDANKNGVPDYAEDGKGKS